MEMGRPHYTPQFSLLEDHGAVRYCHTSGIRCVLVAELREVFRSTAASFSCFSPLFLCFVLFQIGGALPGELLLTSSADRERQGLGISCTETLVLPSLHIHYVHYPSFLSEALPVLILVMFPSTRSS